MIEHNNQDYILFINRFKIKYICCCLFFDIKTKTFRSETVISRTAKLKSQTQTQTEEDAKHLKARDVSINTTTHGTPSQIQMSICESTIITKDITPQPINLPKPSLESDNSTRL